MSRFLRAAALAFVPLAVLAPTLFTAALLGGCSNDKDAAAAAGLFQSQCARCHGADGKGDRRSVGLYPHLDLTASRLARAGAPGRRLIYQRIYDGDGAMPAFGDRLGAESTEKLVDYVLRLAQGKAGR